MIDKITKNSRQLNSNEDVLREIYDKINELVDYVNDITDWVKRTDETIVKYGIKPIENTIISKIEKVDPYAEQRKWIGHLVEYGNADDGFKYGILTNIEPIYEAFPFEIDNGRDATADCWLPDESIIYQKD